VPIYGTIWLITIGLTASYSPRLQDNDGALIQVHKELEEAAEVSGARGEKFTRNHVAAGVAGICERVDMGGVAFSAVILDPLMLGTRNSSALRHHVGSVGSRHGGPTAALGVLLIVALAVITITGRWLVSRLRRQVEGRDQTTSA